MTDAQIVANLHQRLQAEVALRQALAQRIHDIVDVAQVTAGAKPEVAEVLRKLARDLAAPLKVSP